MIYKDGDYKARLAPTKMIHNNSCKRNKLPKNLRRVISCCCCCCCIQSLRSETQKQQTKCLRLWIVLLMSWFGQTRCRATCQGETSTGYRLLLFGCATKHLACQFLLFHWNLYGFLFCAIKSLIICLICHNLCISKVKTFDVFEDTPMGKWALQFISS